jgi:hypothetical protein
VTAAIAAVVVLAAGGTAWYLTHRGDPTNTAAAPVAPAVAAPALPSASRTVATPPSAAPQSLSTRAAADRGTAESMIGYWLPQLSSKQAGLVVNGTTYDDALIMQEFQGLARAYPTAFLVRSDDYSTFKRGGFWVVLAAAPSSSAAQANAWCDAHGFGRDDCFAKRLSHTDGPQGNTVAR